MRGADQSEERCRAITCISAAEMQPVFSSHGNLFHQLLNIVVVDRDLPVRCIELKLFPLGVNRGMYSGVANASGEF